MLRGAEWSGALRGIPDLICGSGDQDDRPRPGAGNSAFQAPAGNIRRLLVVEDDWFIGMELETVLREAGYDVIDVVASADVAVATALRERPDLILMDIRLSGRRDGIDAAIEIRERADIGCIFVSAHQDDAARTRAEGARPVGWVGKPFSHAQVLAAIRDADRKN